MVRDLSSVVHRPSSCDSLWLPFGCIRYVFIGVVLPGAQGGVIRAAMLPLLQTVEQVMPIQKTDQVIVYNDGQELNVLLGQETQGL